MPLLSWPLLASLRYQEGVEEAIEAPQSSPAARVSLFVMVM